MTLIKKMLGVFSRGEVVGTDCFAKTHNGRVRDHNEDTFIIRPEKSLYIVADGMGGHNAGEVASLQTAKTFDRCLTAERLGEIKGNPGEIKGALLSCMTNAHNTLAAMSREKKEYQGMGTTAVTVLIDDSSLHVCHVGDSRAYRSDGEKLTLLTMDHSYVMELVKAGKLSMDEARSLAIKNELTQAIGPAPSISPDYNCYPLSDGDIILLCSDGLWDMVPDTVIFKVLKETEKLSLKEMGKLLVKLANHAGGNDNITVVLIRHRT